MQIQKNAHDSNRAKFTETSSPDNDGHCSQETSNDSRQPNTGTQIGLITRSSLNTNDVVCKWPKKKVIYMNSNESQKPKLLHFFITGGSGVGKSHFIHTLQNVTEKNFTDNVGSAEKLKILLLTPAEVSAKSINGTTIHQALKSDPHLPKSSFLFASSKAL